MEYKITNKDTSIRKFYDQKRGIWIYIQPKETVYSKCKPESTFFKVEEKIERIEKQTKKKQTLEDD